MHVTDAQTHIWGSGLPSNLAHRQVTSFTAAEVIRLMDEGGVDADVIYPPPSDPGVRTGVRGSARLCLPNGQ